MWQTGPKKRQTILWMLVGAAMFAAGYVLKAGLSEKHILIAAFVGVPLGLLSGWLGHLRITKWHRGGKSGGSQPEGMTGRPRLFYAVAWFVGSVMLAVIIAVVTASTTEGFVLTVGVLTLLAISFSMLVYVSQPFGRKYRDPSSSDSDAYGSPRP